MNLKKKRFLEENKELMRKHLVKVYGLSEDATIEEIEAYEWYLKTEIEALRDYMFDIDSRPQR